MPSGLLRLPSSTSRQHNRCTSNHCPSKWKSFFIYSNFKKCFCQTTTISIIHWDIVCRGQCSHLMATVFDSSLADLTSRHCVNAAIYTVHKGSWTLDWINLVSRNPCEWTLNTRHWLWCKNTTFSSVINIAADEEIFQPLLNIVECWFPLRC